MTERLSNALFLGVLQPVALEGVGWYCRVLSERDYATQIALVERFVGLGFTKGVSEAGGAKVILDADDRVFSDPLPGAETVRVQDQEALWQIIEDGVVRAEFLAEDLKEDVIHPVSGLRTTEISGRGIGCVLEWAKVLPVGMPVPASTSREFKGVHPIAVWLTLFHEAQAQGFIPFVSVSFDADADSQGNPWADTVDLTVQAGEDLMALLTRWCEAYGLVWKMNTGFIVEVRPEAASRHLEGQVVFTAHRDQNEHSRMVSRREIANVVYTETSVPSTVEGQPDGLVIAQATDTTSQARWRKRALWLSAGDAGGPSAASAVSNVTLGLLKDAKQSRTIKIDPMVQGRRPFDDFDVSDWVAVELEDGASDSEARQVMAISVDLSDDGYPVVELTLQSRFESRQIKQQKMLDKMGSGGSASASTPIPASSAIAASKLGDLQDVDATNVLEGSVLQRVGGKWVDVTPNLSFLTDVDTSGVASGNALVFDAATGLWKPGAPSYTVTVDWADVQNKPATFPPATHSHLATGISDSTATGRAVLTAASATAARTAIGAGTSSLVVGTGAGDAKAGNWVPAWTEVTGKPSSFEPVAKPLDFATDVDTTTAAPADGQALVWNAASGLWKPGTVAAGGGGGSTTLDGLTDVVTSGANAPAAGNVLAWDQAAAVWKPAVPGVPSNSVPRQVGSTTATPFTDSGSAYAAFTTNLTVRQQMTLTGIDFWVITAGSYTVTIDGVAIAGPVSFGASAGTSNIMFANPVTLQPGAHTVKISATPSVRWRYRNVPSIDYVGQGYDFTTAGWVELGAFAPMWVFRFSIPAEVATMDKALVGHVKYGTGVATAIASGAAGFGEAAQFPDMVFTLPAAATVQLDANLYLLSTASNTDFCLAISNDNWSSYYVLDRYHATLQPPASWQVQYGKLRYQPNANYGTPVLPPAILTLPAGAYKVRLWKITNPGFTIAEHGGFATARLLDAVTASAGGSAWTVVAEEPGTSFGSWTGLAGTWSVSGGEIVQSSTSGTTRAVYNVRLPMAGPLVIDLELKMDSAGANGNDRQVGILLGYNGTNAAGAAYCRLNWDGASGYNVQMEQDATLAKVSRGNTGWRPDEWHRFRIHWNGSSATLWHNGVMMGSGMNMTLHHDGSYLGLKTNAASARFRNIKVYSPPQIRTADFPASLGGRTALVNYPPSPAGMTTTTATAFRGTYFTCTATTTVKELRARIVGVATRVYILGVYELAADRVTIAAVTGEAQVTAAGGDQTLTAAVNIPLVPGRAYVVMVGSSAGCTHYYQGVGPVADSPVTMTVYQGGVDPARAMLSGAPAVGTVLSKGSDYNGLGMTLDY